MCCTLQCARRTLSRLDLCDTQIEVHREGWVFGVGLKGCARDHGGDSFSSNPSGGRRRGRQGEGEDIGRQPCGGIFSAYEAPDHGADLRNGAVQPSIRAGAQGVGAVSDPHDGDRQRPAAGVGGEYLEL